MEYEVGSLADLISGTKTPNKQKVVQKEFKIKNNVENGNVATKKKKQHEKVNNIETDTNELTKIASAPQTIDNAAQIKKLKNAAKKLKRRNKRMSNGDTNGTSNDDTNDNSDDVVPKKKSKPSKEIDIPQLTEPDVEPEDASSDSDDDETEKKTKKTVEVLHNAVKRMKAKETKEKHAGDTEENKPMFNDRTIFVGNVSINTKRKNLRKLFSKYGTVEAVRFRCAPVADPRTPKKVAVIKNEFHADRDSLHAYVRFETREAAQKAVQANGTSFENKHIRVNICSETDLRDEKKAIFIGNLSFDAEDEDLWGIFEPCGKIESVRIVRDRRTNVGKGFGYVNFESSDSVELALQMENVMFKNREIRISASNASSAKTKKKENKSLIKMQGNHENDAIKRKPLNIKDKAFQGSKFADKKKKKFNKGIHQKKKMVKQLAPLPAA